MMSRPWLSAEEARSLPHGGFRWTDLRFGDLLLWMEYSSRDRTVTNLRIFVGIKNGHPYGLYFSGYVEALHSEMYYALIERVPTL